MPTLTADPAVPARSEAWKWWICGLLLLATMLNYMDRMTLNQAADHIMESLDMEVDQYGYVESAFAVAFALGALLVGSLADRWNVYWIYPVVLVAWSLAGLATGFVTSFIGLLACRFCLGLAEAGNWPCALRTTQRILTPAQRAMGNGILQSGAALGAIITPIVVLGFLNEWTGNWRHPFLVIGGLGCLWPVLWLVMVSRRDLALPPVDPDRAPAAGLEGEPFGRAVLSILSRRRFWVLAALVVSINVAWHFFRSWMPLFLKRAHHYGEAEAQLFTSAYYIAADLGSLSAGLAALWLTRRGLSVHNSRRTVFLGGSLLAALSLAAAVLPTGPLLLVVLLVIAFGALAVFPIYYSLSQEISVRHQGKVTGLLGCTCWMSVAATQALVGNYVKATGSYTLAVALAGLLPLAGFVVLLLFWDEKAPAAGEVSVEAQEVVRGVEVAGTAAAGAGVKPAAH